MKWTFIDIPDDFLNLSPVLDLLDLSLALLDLLDLSPIFGLSKFDYLKQKSVFFVNDAL